MVDPRRCGSLLLWCAFTATFLAAAASAPAADASQLYRLRPDPRLCPSPACGGFFASRVNTATTRCIDGGTRLACYVASVDLTGLTAAAARTRPALSIGKLLVRGSFASYPGPSELRLATLAARQAWLPAGNAEDSGATLYRVVDTGIRCVRAPCFSVRATIVNTSRSTMLSGVDLAAPGVSPAALRRARALLGRDGVLVSGRVRTVTDPDPRDTGRVLDASQVWLPA
jgi:hypothetical protein